MIRNSYLISSKSTRGFWKTCCIIPKLRLIVTQKIFLTTDENVLFLKIRTIPCKLGLLFLIIVVSINIIILLYYKHKYLPVVNRIRKHAVMFD